MEATVTDAFEVKGRVAIEYGEAGVVVCFASDSEVDPPRQGKDILLVRPDGWMVRTRMGEVKPGGNSRLHTVFISNLTKADVPVGSHVRWGTDFWPGPSEERTAPSTLVRA